MSTLPIVLLSGFLGSGKTTVLNHWLGQRDDLALIINELGQEGIDQHLTAATGVPVTLMAGGCLCCAMQGSLPSTLRNLYMARQGGQLPAFSTLVIETTGAADPFSVLAVLEQDSWLRKRFHWQAVISTVDAEQGVAALAAHPEVMEQVTAADVLLISKTDRVAPENLDALQQQLSRLNPDARILPISQGRAPATLLDEHFPRRCRVLGIRPGSLGTVGFSGLSSPFTALQASKHDIHSASLRMQLTLPWELWQAALGQLQDACGSALLRIKGLLAVEGLDGPLLVQQVASQLPELSPLPRWPDDDTETRLVLICRHQQADFPAKVLAQWQKSLLEISC